MTTRLAKPVPQATPGPWYHEPYDSGDRDAGLQASPAFVYAELEDGRTIDIAYMEEPMYTVGRVNEYDEGEHWSGSMNGNARLIAAAPELLKACEIALDFMTRFERSMLTNSAEDVKLLRHVIAKARGEETP
jgi:hypothetical protein